MSAPILQVWSAPKCQTDAQPIAALPAITSAQITERINGADAGTIILPFDVAQQSGIAEGRIIRAIVPLRGVIEWVVIAVSDTAAGAPVSVTLGPLRQLLALRGFVRETTNTAVGLTFTPLPLSVEEFLTRYVLTNLEEDSLSWLSVGTIEYDGLIEPGTFTVVRRGELLTLLERITGCEVSLRRRTQDAGYVIDVLQQRGDTLPTVLIEAPSTALSISRIRDLTRSSTAVVPVGTDTKAMGEVDWTGGTAIGTGPWWIPLTDPAAGAAPIREDGQFAGAYLLLVDGTTLPITTTRASDSAVQVQTLGSYTAGQRVILVESSTRRPVSMITSPAALDEARGLIVARVTAKGARQERTLNRNAGFEDGATQWYEVNGTGQFSVLQRSEFGTSLSFLANGARAGGTSAATPLAVDGLPPNTWLRRGDWMVHDSASRDIGATAQSSALGAVTFTIASPGLPTALTDGNTVTVNRELNTVATSAIAVPRLGGVLYLTASSVGTADLQLMMGNRRMAEPSGYVFAGPNGSSLDFYAVPWDASRIAVRYQFTSNDPVVESVPYGQEALTITAIGAQRIQVTLGTAVQFGTLTVGQWVRIDTTNSANWGAIGLSKTDAPWLYPIPVTGARLIGQVANLSTGIVEVDLVGYPPSADFRTIGAMTPSPIGPHPDVLAVGYPEVPTLYGFNTVWASGTSFTLSRPGTMRTVQVNGAYSSGATSVTTKAIAAIATRAWQSGDTLFVAGSPAQSYEVTGAATHATASGIAAVPVSIPSGVTLKRGTMVWSNAHGRSSASALSVATTVTGPASTVDVFAGDTLVANESDGGLVASYRVYGGTGVSSLRFPGNEMLVWSSVQANSAGQASVFLGFAPVNDIADNAPITITRPVLFGPRDHTAGSALRLVYAPGSGSPSIAVTATQSETVFIPVTTGEPVTVRAVARFRVTPETLAIGAAPVVAIVNTVAGTVLATGAIAAQTTYTAPYGEIVCTATTTLAASASLAIRIYGGSNSSWQARWHVCTDASFYVGADILPYAAGARSRIAWQRGQDVLAQRKSSARYTVRGLDQAALADSGTPIQIGQNVRLRSESLELDTTERIVGLTWRWPGAELVEMECAALTPRLTDVEVSS